MIHRSEIISQFRDFQKEGIPKEVSAYNPDHINMMCQVFVIVKTPLGIIAPGSVSIETVYSFPIAKVLQVGSKWPGVKAEVGDIVRLKDFDAMTRDNAAFLAYLKGAEMTKNGNLEANGPIPSPTIMNLWEVHGRKVFHPDPFFQREPGSTEYPDTFMFFEGDVVCKIDHIENIL